MDIQEQKLMSAIVQYYLEYRFNDKFFLPEEYVLHTTKCCHGNLRNVHVSSKQKSRLIFKQ